MTEQRAVIVVDIESTGLTRPRHRAVEVAWLNMATGEWGRFCPYVSPLSLANAEPVALELNRYATRIAGSDTDDGTGAVRLHRQLQGQVLAGSNPAFDAGFLGDLFSDADCDVRFEWGELGPIGPSRVARLREPWHHRLGDVACYAAGKLGLPMSELPGLAKVCELLGVENQDPHSALGDVTATAECLYRLGAVPRPDEIGAAS